jgi:hypothetical protein
MGVRSAGHENRGDQEYCSECGQPIPTAGLVGATQARHLQPDGIEPQAAVQPPPVSSPESARASRPATSDTGGAAATPTARRPRSGRRPAAPASERSLPPANLRPRRGTEGIYAWLHSASSQLSSPLPPLVLAPFSAASRRAVQRRSRPHRLSRPGRRRSSRRYRSGRPRTSPRATG